MDVDNQFKVLQALQQSDHDTLVRVEAKMDNTTDEIKRLSNDISKYVGDHETRIRILEKSSDSLSPVDIYNRLSALEKEATTSTINWKVVGILTTIFTIVVTIAANLVEAYIANHH